MISLKWLSKYNEITCLWRLDSILGSLFDSFYHLVHYRHDATLTAFVAGKLIDVQVIWRILIAQKSTDGSFVNELDPDGNFWGGKKNEFPLNQWRGTIFGCKQQIQWPINAERIQCRYEKRMQRINCIAYKIQCKLNIQSFN